MATIPVAAKAPAKSATGANFVKSQGHEGVKPATDRGETSVGGTYCEAKRSANQYGH